MKPVRIGLPLALTLATAPPAATQAPKIGVDPRVELMAVLFRYAGNPEYNQGRLQPYNAEIEEHFGPYRDHAAVALARGLREDHGVGFSTVMSIAVHLTDPPELEERTPFDAPEFFFARYLGEKAPQAVADVRHFLVEARRFAAESRAEEFFAAHRALYDTAQIRLRRMIEQNADLTWFGPFSGAQAGGDFVIVPLLANSGTNFGPSVDSPGLRPERYAILSHEATDSAGFPVYDEGRVPTLIHEFGHTYANPAIEPHLPRLESAGPRIYGFVSDAMRDGGYGRWESVLRESVVEAMVARYALATHGPEAAQRQVAEAQAQGHLWMPELFDLFGEYEADRRTYPTFESFTPRVAEYFGALPDRMEEIVRRYDERRPRIVSLSIENGSDEIDPALSEIIIRFDRPVRTNYRPVHRVRGKTLPEITEHGLDATGSTFRMAVKLEPGQAYEFSLNRPSGRGFVSEEGVPLAPYHVRFKTRPASE